MRCALIVVVVGSGGDIVAGATSSIRLPRRPTTTRIDKGQVRECMVRVHLLCLTAAVQVLRQVFVPTVDPLNQIVV